MALTNCPECQHSVSDKATTCPSCGYPLANVAKLTPSLSAPATGAQRRRPRVKTHRRPRLWVGTLIFLGLLVAMFVPAFALTLGGLILIICATSVVPGIRFSRRMLRMDGSRLWLDALRITLYGFAGFLLVVMGIGGSVYQRAQREAAEIETAANTQVAELAAEAETAWMSGELSLVEEKLSAASSIKNASDAEPILRLRTKIANAEVAALMAGAEAALEAANLAAAEEKVTTALGVRFADDLYNAKKLKQQMGMAQDPASMRAALMSLADDSFEKYRNERIIPASFVSGYEALDRQIADMAADQFPEASRVRDRYKQARIAEERKRAQRDREEKLQSVGKVDAWVMAQQFVESQLKSPSSADFGGIFSDYQSPEEVVTKIGVGKFRVRAWVDAQNSFGATLRNHFLCELEYVGDDRWRLTNLVFLE